MTGFARANGCLQTAGESIDWAWEIKSVNAKGIDIKTRTPLWLEDINEGIKNICSKNFARGTFSISLDIKVENSNPEVQINSELLDTLTDKIKQIY